MSSSIGIGVPVPKMLPMTGTWTLPFAAYLLFLSNRIVYYRLKHEKFIGDRIPIESLKEEDDPLTLSTRAHANFIENVPLAFILAAVAELNGGNRKGLNYAMGALLVLRIAHAEFGIMAKDGMGSGRPVGFYGTQGLLAGLAAYGTYLVKGYWGY
ncbi:hypothetical protein MMC12_003574 [Toensbergia leucococca]|nr:hypothetical protein [Toensbergia leucococca]